MAIETQDNIETTQQLTPRFDSQGLVTAVVTDCDSGLVLVVAHMNSEAIAQTLASKQVHFWSRSRQCLWRKGEQSGNSLALVEMRIDCDQDAIWIRAKPTGPTCHTGAKSCFYRRIASDRKLTTIPEEKQR